MQLKIEYLIDCIADIKKVYYHKIFAFIQFIYGLNFFFNLELYSSNLVS